MESRELDIDVAGCAAAHQALLATLDAMSEDQARAPSVLPGWTVGHVATHLARNAEAFTGMLLAANEGDVAHMYPGGFEQRESDINVGAVRGAPDLVADVRAGIWELEGTWANLSTRGWQGSGITPLGPIKIADIPFRRWREVVVHHGDLGLGYSWRAWPHDYVAIELVNMNAMWANKRPNGGSVPAQALDLEPNERLAWLMGRTVVEGLEPARIY